MRRLGLCLLVVGGLVAAYALLIFDASVGSDFGSRRIMNLGLMQDRQNMLIAGCVAAIVGTLLVVFAKSIESTAMARNANDFRACPFCAEPIRMAAVICKHCGKDVVSMAPQGQGEHPAAIPSSATPSGVAAGARASGFALVKEMADSIAADPGTKAIGKFVFAVVSVLGALMMLWLLASLLLS